MIPILGGRSQLCRIRCREGLEPAISQECIMQITVNGSAVEVDVEPDTPLLWVIREELGLTGTKFGCGLAQCGACTVLVDGQPTRSCITPVDSVEGQSVTTIEAVEEDAVGRRVVAAWVEHQVPQCGYCQSGQVLTATALLQQIPHPTEDDIAGAMVNLCRCGTYNKIRDAVHAAAEV
jgi:isoquinoline 1-oxidoreductase alpha subunit